MTPEQALAWLRANLSPSELMVLEVLHPEKPESKFGCHCDLEPGQKPDGCVLDIDRPQDCVHARILLKQNQGRNDCGYWCIIKA